jgi:hypothetical protein
MSIMQRDFSSMGDAALTMAIQFAQRNNDTLAFLSLATEADERKKMRAAAQGRQAGQQSDSQPVVTEADKIVAGISDKQQTGVANLPTANLPTGNQEYARGGIVSFAAGGGPDEMEMQRVSDRQAAADLFSALKKGSRDAGASIMDLATLFPRGVAGAYDAAVVRPMRAMGANAAYLAPNLQPEGTSLDSMTPFYDKYVRGSAAVPATAPASYGGEARPDRNVPALPAAPPAPASYGGEARPDRNVRALPAPPPRKTGIDTLDTSRKAAPAAVAPTIAAAEGAPPTLTPSVVENAMSAEERKKAAKALAKGDDEAYDAIHAKATARAEKRRAELDAETTPTKGLLGLNMSPETRKLLRDAGVGMMTSKSTNALGGIGEGLQKAATEYDAGKTRRTERADLLDAADDKRAAAQLAAKQGNMNAARQFQADADKAQQDAVGNTFKKDEGAVARYAAQAVRQHYLDQAKQGIAQLTSNEKIAAGNNAATMGAANVRATRENVSPQMQLLNSIMAANPKMTMQQALQETSQAQKEAMTPKDALALYQQEKMMGTTTLPFYEFYQNLLGPRASGSGNMSTPSTGWGQANVKPPK